MKVKGNTFVLTRDSDGAGDDGSMLKAIDPATGKQQGEEGEIHLGCSVQCGSRSGRTMQWQDWWLTTPVTEIVEVSNDGATVKFKTKNSSYTLRGY